MSSSSARPTASATRPGDSPSGEMDNEEPMVDCNLPELLVRDLETSEDIFISKAMTAGCPYVGLAAPELNTSLRFQKPLLRHRASYQQQYQESQGAMGKLRLQSLPTDEANLCLEHPRRGRQRGVENGSPGASSVTSAGMEPLSIRTRQQSVTTAATSLSGRCSSLYSHGTLSPTSPVLSPCSSNREGSLHGTWFEDEPESPQDEPGTSVFTARTSISEPHQPTLILGDEDDMAAAQKPTTDGDDIPIATAFYLAGGRYGTHSRPHTPASQLHIEKPRIIDIPPIAMGLNRTGSQRKRRYGAESTSMTSESQATAAAGLAPLPTIEPPRQAVYEDAFQEQAGSILSLLATANGRTVIDASSPPPIPFARANQSSRHRRSCSPPPLALDEYEPVDDQEAPATKVYVERLSEAHGTSLADLRSRIEASAETLTSHDSAPYTPNTYSPPGIPLPPEVIESLRVSVSCFPETMLLTSSLSIETIRAYSRKVTHRTNLDRHLRGTDSDSLYSSTSHNPKPSKRWNMSWLGHARRSSKYHHHNPHYFQQPEQYHSFPPRIVAASSQAILANLTPKTTTPTHSPPWSPLQAIFPSASPHLCDALYAHLLAYNYIASLCPTPMPSPSPSPPLSPSLETPFVISSMHISGGRRRGGGNGREGLKIPQKAANLLGMDDPASVSVSTSAAAAAYQQRQRPNGRRASGSGRGLLSRNRSACRRTTATSGGGAAGHHALSDLLTPRFGGGGGARHWHGHGHGHEQSEGGVAPRGGTSHHGSSSSAAAVPRSGVSSHVYGQEGQGMMELLVGLGRCVDLLVATMIKGAGWGVMEEEEDSLLGGEKGEGVEGVEPVLMRALCEIVRCSEEGGLRGS